MVNFRFDAGFRRREVFRLAAITGLAVWAESLALAASDFWNKKKPSEWTEQEQLELITKSPWSKQIDAQILGNGLGTSAAGEAAIPTASLEVVWQSAQAISDAHPLKFPDTLNGHYLIAVTGIPGQALNAALQGNGGRSGGGAGSGTPAPPADPNAGLKRGATLTAKGKAVPNADVVVSMNKSTTILFGFSKGALPLTAADREVDFELKLGGLSGKARFILKDMMYNGELAL
jgi:hypothetical protein